MSRRTGRAAASWAAFGLVLLGGGWALGRTLPHELYQPVHHCFFVQRAFYRGVDEHLSDWVERELGAVIARDDASVLLEAQCEPGVVGLGIVE